MYQYPVSLRPHQRWIGVPNKGSAASRPSMGLGSNMNMDVPLEEPPKIKMGNKLLPDVPLSNRKLFMQHARRSGRNGLPNQNVWASSLPISFQSVPPLVPPPRVGLNPDKASKLAAILAESDSEDERIVIPKSTEGFEIGKNIFFFLLICKLASKSFSIYSQIVILTVRPLLRNMQ